MVGRSLDYLILFRVARMQERRRSIVLCTERQRKFEGGRSFGFFFELDVMELDGEAIARAKAFGELFGKKDGAVLAAGAAERDHEAFEAAGLVVGDARVDERVNAGEELVNAFLLTEIVD